LKDLVHLKQPGDSPNEKEAKLDEMSSLGAVGSIILKMTSNATLRAASREVSFFRILC